MQRGLWALGIGLFVGCGGVVDAGQRNGALGSSPYTDSGAPPPGMPSASSTSNGGTSNAGASPVPESGGQATSAGGSSEGTGGARPVESGGRQGSTGGLPASTGGMPAPLDTGGTPTQVEPQNDSGSTDPVDAGPSDAAVDTVTDRSPASCTPGCDDGMDCTDDSCQNGSCSHVTQCTNGDFCTTQGCVVQTACSTGGPSTLASLYSHFHNPYTSEWLDLDTGQMPRDIFGSPSGSWDIHLACCSQNLPVLVQNRAGPVWLAHLQGRTFESVTNCDEAGANFSLELGSEPFGTGDVVLVITDQHRVFKLGNPLTSPLGSDVVTTFEYAEL